MAPQRSVDRDTGMRRISTTTRWLAGIGVGCVAALSVFFAGQASSGSGATTTVPTQATTPATTTAPLDTRPGTATVPTAPPPTAPPMTYPPSRRTTTRGS